MQGRGNGMCKGPEVQMSLLWEEEGEEGGSQDLGGLGVRDKSMF